MIEIYRSQPQPENHYRDSFVDIYKTILDRLGKNEEEPENQVITVSLLTYIQGMLTGDNSLKKRAQFELRKNEAINPSPRQRKDLNMVAGRLCSLVFSGNINSTVKESLRHFRNRVKNGEVDEFFDSLETFVVEYIVRSQQKIVGDTESDERSVFKDWPNIYDYEAYEKQSERKAAEDR